MGFMDGIRDVLGGFNAVKQIDSDGFDWREKRAAQQAARDQEVQQYEQANQDYLTKAGSEAMIGGMPESEAGGVLPADLDPIRRKAAIARMVGQSAQAKSSLEDQKTYRDILRQDRVGQQRLDQIGAQGENAQALARVKADIEAGRQPSPRDLALIQERGKVAGGLLNRAEAGRNARFQQTQDRLAGDPAGGGGRPMASGDVNRVSEMDTALGLLQGELGPQMGETGAGSKVGAMMPNFVSEYTGIGSESKARQALIDKAKQIIGKSLEGGVLRKEDEVKYTKILPTIGDPPDVAMAKVQGLADTIGMKREDLLRALSSAGYRTSGFQTRPKQTGGGAQHGPAVKRRVVNGRTQYRDAQGNTWEE